MSPERPLIGGHNSKMPSPPNDLPSTSFQSPYARKTRPLLGQHPQGIILFGEDKEEEEEMEEKEGVEEEEEE